MQTIMSLVSAYGVQAAVLVAVFVAGVFVQAKHPLLAQTIKNDVAAAQNAVNKI